MNLDKDINSEVSKNLPLWLPVFFVTLVVFGAGFLLGDSLGVDLVDEVRLEYYTPNNLTKKGFDDYNFDPFWKSLALINQKFMSSEDDFSISREDLIYGAIEGMVNVLGDPYTVFLKPELRENFNESMSGNFSGVGMEVGLRDDILTVISPLKNTPADKAGIMSGDKIIKIDDESTEGMDITTAVGKIRGESGTPVLITVLREGSTVPTEIEIIREVIDIPTLEHELTEDNIFIISLYNFGSSSAAEFRNALRTFENSGSDKLILDLRSNPGGYLDAAVDMSSRFLETGKVVLQEDFGNNEIKQVRSRGGAIIHPNLKMVILVNKGSASASEILAGALQEHGVATLVGTQTFGKGSVQEVIDIDKKTSLKVTIAKWLTPNGISISDGGLTPEIIVEEIPDSDKPSDYDTLNDTEKYFLLNDYQLNVAIDTINNI